MMVLGVKPKYTSRSLTLIPLTSESGTYMDMGTFVLITIITNMQVMAISKCWAPINVRMHASILVKVANSYWGINSVSPRKKKRLGIAVVAIYFAAPVSARLSTKYVAGQSFCNH